MIEIGRLILKTAGRDAGKYDLIIDVVDDNFIVIDGQVRRRKVNIKHIEPLLPVLKIQKNAPHEKIVEVLKAEGIDVSKGQPKPAKQKPVKKRTLKIEERKKAKEEKKLSKKKKAEKQKPKQVKVESKTTETKKEEQSLKQVKKEDKVTSAKPSKKTENKEN